MEPSSPQLSRSDTNLEKLNTEVVRSNEIPFPERVFNLLLGLSIISWAVLGLVSNEHPRPLTVRICIAALHIAVAIFILIRTGVRTNGSIQACLVALPAVVIGGWVFAFSPPVWNTTAQAVMVVGTVVSITSVCWLGKSFSILPSVRELVCSGPYRWIRHPIYLGELLMCAGCCLAEAWWQSLLIIIVAIVLVAARIVAEEKLLGSDNQYLAYQAKVKWRLIPMIW